MDAVVGGPIGAALGGRFLATLINERPSGWRGERPGTAHADANSRAVCRPGVFPAMNEVGGDLVGAEGPVRLIRVVWGCSPLDGRARAAGMPSQWREARHDVTPATFA